MRAAEALDQLADELTGDERTGALLLKRAIEEPLRQIAENAGHEGSVVIEEVRRHQGEQKSTNVGFDVLNEQYRDLVAAGIIDPVKVTRSALENASSVAGMILTTEALVTDAPETEKAAPAAGGHGHSHDFD